MMLLRRNSVLCPFCGLSSETRVRDGHIRPAPGSRAVPALRGPALPLSPPPGLWTPCVAYASHLSASARLRCTGPGRAVPGPVRLGRGIRGRHARADRSRAAAPRYGMRVLPNVTATRYVTPLREGGSLPAIVEADDLGTYVVKFHGAGQGRKALVAEVISGELARRLGLPVPALVTIEVDPGLAANEPDEEVQSLLRASGGRNLGVDFLPGALDLDTTAFTLSPRFAGQVLWFDALIGNVDRSWRNPNMLFWHATPYLIDHGAALTF